MILRDLEQLRRFLPLLPQRRPLVRIEPRQQQRPRRALPEPGGEQRRAAHLVGDELLELVGLEDEQLGAGGFALGIRHPRDDAVVARDRRTLDPQPLADAGVDRQRPRGVHVHAVRGMKDDAPIADLVAGALDGEGAVGGETARGLLLLRQIGQQVLDGVVVETRFAQSRDRGVGGDPRHLPGEPAERLTELGGPAEAVAVPERQLAGLPEGGQHVHAVVGDLDDAPARRPEREHIVHARLVDHLLVELADAGVAGLTGHEHPEQAAIRDRPAARHRDALRAGAARQRPVIAVPDDPRPELGELVGRVLPRQQIERRLVRGARQRPERRGATHGLEPSLDIDRFERARGDRLLREDVERILRDAHRLDLARQHPLRDDRRVQDVAAVLGEQGGAADLADLVSGAPDTLQARRRRGRRLDLDDEVDLAHVDAELERTGRDDAAQDAGFQFVLDLRALLLGHRAVVRLRQLGRRPGRRPRLRHHRGGRLCAARPRTRSRVETLRVDLVEPSGEPLGEPTRVREHDRRPVREDPIDDRLLDVRPHRAGDLGRLRWGEPVAVAVRVAAPPGIRRRVVGGTGRRRRIEHVRHRHDDLQVERLGRPRRDDLHGSGPAEEAGDLVDRADGRRQSDALRRREVGIVGATQRVEALEADRQVRTPFGGGDGVHLVDDHGVDAPEGLPRLRGEHEVQRFRRRDEDVRRVGDEFAPVGRGRVARAHPHGDLRQGDAEASRGLSDADQRRTQVALHVDTERLQRGDVEDAGATGILRRTLLLPRARLLRRARRGRAGVGCGRRRLLVEDPVDGPQKRRQRLARPGGRHHQSVPARRDRLPRAGLGGGGLREGATEPVLRRRTEPLEHIRHRPIFPRATDIGAGARAGRTARVGSPDLRQRPLPQLEHEVGRDPAQKAVVVTDDEHGTAVGGERLDHLVDRVEVEVVRRCAPPRVPKAG